MPVTIAWIPPWLYLVSSKVQQQRLNNFTKLVAVVTPGRASTHTVVEREVYASETTTQCAQDTPPGLVPPPPCCRRPWCTAPSGSAASHSSMLNRRCRNEQGCWHAYFARSLGGFSSALCIPKKPLRRGRAAATAAMGMNVKLGSVFPDRFLSSCCTGADDT